MDNIDFRNLCSSEPILDMKSIETMKTSLTVKQEDSEVCCKDSSSTTSVSRRQNKTYKHHTRRIKRSTPYDPVDELNIKRLSISPVKQNIKCSSRLSGSSTDLNVPTKEKVTSPAPLIQPARLSLSSTAKIAHVGSSEHNSKQVPRNEKYFDFASLASQIKTLEPQLDDKTSPFSWSQVRDSLKPSPGIAHSSDSLKITKTHDESEELSSLSSLQLHVEPSRLSTSVERARSSSTGGRLVRSCSQEAMLRQSDFSTEELAYYFDELVYIPKNMSLMAEMMYT